MEIILPAERKNCHVLVGIQSISFKDQAGDMLECAATGGYADLFSFELLEIFNPRF